MTQKTHIKDKASISTADENDSQHSSDSHSTTPTDQSDLYSEKSHSIDDVEAAASKSLQPQEDSSLEALKEEALQAYFRQYAEEHNIWVQMLYKDSILACENGRWRLKRKLCPEKYIEDEYASHARGVFECVRINKDEREDGDTKIMKIYIQTDGDPIDVPEPVADEIKALQRIAHVEQTEKLPAPRLCDKRVTGQVQDEWVAGGYLVFIVMEKCPGKALRMESFYKRRADDRNKIRGTFKEALEKLWRSGVYPHDYSIHNIIWDEKKQQCHIVDLEGAGSRNRPYEGGFSEYVYRNWDLTGYGWENGRLYGNIPENDWPGIDRNGALISYTGPYHESEEMVEDSNDDA